MPTYIHFNGPFSGEPELAGSPLPLGQEEKLWGKWHRLFS